MEGKCLLNVQYIVLGKHENLTLFDGHTVPMSEAISCSRTKHSPQLSSSLNINFM